MCVTDLTRERVAVENGFVIQHNNNGKEARKEYRRVFGPNRPMDEDEARLYEEKPLLRWRDEPAAARGVKGHAIADAMIKKAKKAAKK